MLYELPLLGLLCALASAQRSLWLSKFDVLIEVQSSAYSVPVISLEDCAVWMLKDQNKNYTMADYDEGTCRILEQPGTVKTIRGSSTLVVQGTSIHNKNICGLWPMTSDYGGQDVSGNGNSMGFTDVTMEEDGIALKKETSRVRISSSTSMSLGNKFSWIARVNSSSLEDGILFHYTCNNPTHMKLHGHQFFAYARRWYRTCEGGDQSMYHSKKLTPGAWHTLAVSFDGPDGVMKMWVDGIEEKKTFTPCDNQLWSDGVAWFDVAAKLRCMGLFRDALDYDTMLMSTAAVCGFP